MNRNINLDQKLNLNAFNMELDDELLDAPKTLDLALAWCRQEQNVLPDALGVRHCESSVV